MAAAALRDLHLLLLSHTARRVAAAAAAAAGSDATAPNGGAAPPAKKCDLSISRETKSLFVAWGTLCLGHHVGLGVFAVGGGRADAYSFVNTMPKGTWWNRSNH